MCWVLCPPVRGVRVRSAYHDERARRDGSVCLEREVRQARERPQARPGGGIEGREAVVQELQVCGAREEGVREAARCRRRGRRGHKGKGREARRVDGAVAREVVHGAADGEDARDVCDWGGEVQHEMPDMRAKQLVLHNEAARGQGNMKRRRQHGWLMTSTPLRRRRGARAEEVAKSVIQPSFISVGGVATPQPDFNSIRGSTGYSARSKADGVLTVVSGCPKTASK
ncbi:hypothetical protein C8J57DRAFT_1234026 [Mycena rebaudengoi]|nr:hypothetical protein C8J57DRAFT_1234026 [Mycena rebaudengoi]